MWLIFSTASLDGRIATVKGDSELSCKYDLELLHKFRCWSDLVLVGANTAIVDDPGLFVKRVNCLRQPYRGIVDGRLRVPLNLRLFVEQPWMTIVLTTVQGVRENEVKYRTLLDRGVRVIVAGNGPKVNLKEAKLILNEMGIRKVLIEGGGALNWSAIRDDVVDRIEVTYVGKVLGAGVPLVYGEGYEMVRDAPLFLPVEIKKCRCGRCVHISWARSGINNQHCML